MFKRQTVQTVVSKTCLKFKEYKCCEETCLKDKQYKCCE